MKQFLFNDKLVLIMQREDTTTRFSGASDMYQWAKEEQIGRRVGENMIRTEENK